MPFLTLFFRNFSPCATAEMSPLLSQVSAGDTGMGGGASIFPEVDLIPENSPVECYGALTDRRSCSADLQKALVFRKN